MPKDKYKTFFKFFRRSLCVGIVLSLSLCGITDIHANNNGGEEEDFPTWVLPGFSPTPEPPNNEVSLATEFVQIRPEPTPVVVTEQVIVTQPPTPITPTPPLPEPEPTPLPLPDQGPSVEFFLPSAPTKPEPTPEPKPRTTAQPSIFGNPKPPVLEKSEPAPTLFSAPKPTSTPTTKPVEVPPEPVVVPPVIQKTPTIVKSIQNTISTRQTSGSAQIKTETTKSEPTKKNDISYNTEKTHLVADKWLDVHMASYLKSQEQSRFLKMLGSASWLLILILILCMIYKKRHPIKQTSAHYFRNLKHTIEKSMHIFLHWCIDHYMPNFYHERKSTEVLFTKRKI